MAHILWLLLLSDEYLLLVFVLCDDKLNMFSLIVGQTKQAT